MCSPTTASAWAKTARRTSPSNTLPSLRLIPNLDVWRPGDTAETAVAWAVALQNKTKPTALLLSRQNISYAPKAESALAPDAWP